MAWNTTESILGTVTKGTQDAVKAVSCEADTIFTAAFIGMVIYRGQKGYRVDMEPSMDPKKDPDPKKNQLARSEEDRAGMQRLNDVCAKVNHIVRSYEPLQEDQRGIHWGLTPEFNPGGMIAGGDASLKAYGDYSKEFLAKAWEYLTKDKDGKTQSVYIGRGAYCGLVVDEHDDAVVAMSTLRTTLPPPSGTTYPVDPGDRWLPPQDSAAFQDRKNREKGDPKFAWGMIGGSALQGDLHGQGMKFVPEQPDPVPGRQTVGYTHGMIRAIYESKRIGAGRPFEMSLGTNTAKLASCMSCSLFMVANGYTPSASHLGRGESWLPLYHTDQHVFSYKPNADTKKSQNDALVDAIRAANEQWAAKMRDWMWTGVQAMKAREGWIKPDHVASLEALYLKLSRLGHSPADLMASANLYLDAMTVHGNDAERLDNTLKFGADPRPGCGPDKSEPPHADTDWLVQSWRNHPWMTTAGPYKDKCWGAFENPFSDGYLKDFAFDPKRQAKS